MAANPDFRGQFMHSRIARRQVAVRNMKKHKRVSAQVDPFRHLDDLLLVDGNPLQDIKNLRRVSRVVTNGRMFDSRKLGQSVGFTR